MDNWHNCKNILCIRPDNLGDLIMSSPAIRALKESFGCRITVLTSPMAGSIACHLPEIDDVIEYSVPWVKSVHAEGAEGFGAMVEEIRSRRFDGAVVFTVYSQNPLPSVLLAYLAGVPRRLAYCRENPYALLTDWIPDPEPYTQLRHQVRRDLDLVGQVGAFTRNEELSLHHFSARREEVENKLKAAGVAPDRPWIVVHAGVSEEKRMYPEELWVRSCRRIRDEFDVQLLLTGTQNERPLAERLQKAIGRGAYAVAGLFPIDEFIILIRHAALVLSVNTATVHIAAAVQTPVVVLYALTNPQHLPWKARGKVLLFDVPQGLRSRNEVIRYTSEYLMPQNIGMVTPQEVLQAVRETLLGEGNLLIPELIPLQAADQLL